MSENLDKVCVSDLAFMLESLIGFARADNTPMEKFVLGKIFGYTHALMTTEKMTAGQQVRVCACGQEIQEMVHEKLKFDEIRRKIPELLRDALK